MDLSRTVRNFLILFAFSAVGAITPGRAFLIKPMPDRVTVVEFWNQHLDHYFLSANPAEQAAIDAGAAGPGWMRTGYGFRAYSAAPGYGSCGERCVPVARFYGTPGIGPNSHFFTADANEAAGLRLPASGWTFESHEFKASVPAAGSCPGDVPVFRLYNNRHAVNDSNHRYVTSEAERAAMRARGWVDEGVRFCALGTEEVALRAYRVEIDLDRRILPTAACEDEASGVGPCLAVSNLPVPRERLVNADPSTIERFTHITGLVADRAYVPALAAPDTMARNVFVQGDELIWGLHVDSQVRGSSPVSSISPMYQMRTTVPAGSADERFFPWASGPPFATQLSMIATVEVVRVSLRNAASHAYGAAVIEFADRASGLSFYYAVLAYGSSGGADLVARDVVTGKPIVGTSARAGSPYGRPAGSVFMDTPRGLDARVSGTSRFGRFDFRLDRAEFARALAAARTLEPGLSENPANYLVDNFHFRNEVAGDGEIGMYLHQVALRLLRR